MRIKPNSKLSILDFQNPISFNLKNGESQKDDKKLIKIIFLAPIWLPYIFSPINDLPKRLKKSIEMYFEIESFWPQSADWAHKNGGKYFGARKWAKIEMSLSSRER